MKTPLKLILISLLLSIPTLPGRAAAAAELTLDRAQGLSEWLLRFRRESGIYGDFRAGAPYMDDVFERARAEIDTVLPNGPYQIVAIHAFADAVSLEVRSQPTGRVLRLTSLRETRAETARVRVSEGFREMLRLVIEDRQSWRDARTGSFVTLTRAFGGTDNRLDVGRSFGVFTLSVFGRTLSAQDPGVRSQEDLDAVGASAAIRVDLGGGFSVGLRGEISEVRATRLQLTQGRYRWDSDSHHEGLARLEIQKTFGLSGYRANAGFKLKFLGARGFAQEAAKEVFVGLGRVFRDSRGREIGSLDVLASREVGMDTDEWMVAVTGGFKF